MDYSILAAELSNDPLTRGYAGMTSQQAADDLNTAYRDHNRDAMSGDEIFSVTDKAQFAALASSKQLLWLTFTRNDSINPFASANVDFTQWIFGSGTSTLVALASARKEKISRATELQLGFVRAGDVEYARGA